MAGEVQLHHRHAAEADGGVAADGRRQAPELPASDLLHPLRPPDAPGGTERKSARQKLEDRKVSWRKNIKGADRVAIHLVSAGGVLEPLAQHPNQRGIAWFFWDKEVFSQQWLAKRLTVTVKAAGERYSPQLHVNLPVAFALEGLAGTEQFWRRYRERRASVAAAFEHIDRRGYEDLGVAPQVRALRAVGSRWEVAVPDVVDPPGRLPRTALLEITRELRNAAAQAHPDPAPRRGKATEEDRQLEERRRALRHFAGRLVAAADDLASFLETAAARAAERGALLLTGEAGQGKTHLLCDVGERAIATERPAIVLLGARLTGRRFWSDCAEYLGLAQIGGEALLGGSTSAQALQVRSPASRSTELTRSSS